MSYNVMKTEYGKAAYKMSIKVKRAIKKPKLYAFTGKHHYEY